MSFIPADEAARARARTDFQTSLVLEAGAGTGKTTLLVDRIEALVRTGTARIDEIAAVTFTENAAATMKLRLRDRLERARADAALSAEERARADAALASLERAQVSTIHAFCAALLQERPLEFGVLPGFRVADEAETDALFAEAWDEWMAETLDAGAPVLGAALREGIPLESFGPWGESTTLRGLARTLLWQRDLRPLIADDRPTPDTWREELLARAARAQVLLREVKDGDTLAPFLERLVAHAEASRRLSGDDLLRHLMGLLGARGNTGRRTEWSTAEALAEARDIARWASDTKSAWIRARGTALHADLVQELQGVVARYERKKTEKGRLDFVDLLRRTRDVLLQDEALRTAIARRYRQILIDEFQDTDPLQVEIAELLSQALPGRLTVVGDAKQSIYRFRRAEVSLFRRVSALAAERPGHAVLQLTQNFRSRPAILRFVNRAFAALIEAGDEQPPYDPIVPPPGLPEDAAVIAVALESEEDEEGATVAGRGLLESEAEALAALIAQGAQGSFEVRDGHHEDGSPRTRRSRAGDVMILAPRLTQTRPLEEALLGHGIRFSVEGGKSFFNRQEVHEVLAALRAIDDPADRVSLVAALRSGFFGVSDRELVGYALAGGRLSLFAPPDTMPEEAETLCAALAFLRELHDERTRRSVPALIERLYDGTRVLAALVGDRRGEAQAANLEKVVSLARQAGELGVLTLRGFTRLLAERIEDGGEEADLPSSRPGDPDTVRILSIHKAKGLEAPIVVLFDQAYRVQDRPDVIALWDERRVAIGFRQGCRPPNWSVLEERDKRRARAESKRLLYVACTRARDVLVTALPSQGASMGDFWRELHPYLRNAPADEVRRVEAAVLRADAPARPERMDAGDGVAPGGGDPVDAAWTRARRERVEIASVRGLVPISATRVAARTAPPPVAAAVVTDGIDGGVAPGARGGRDFGSLVHRILEWTPLDAPLGAAAMAESLAPSFGVDAEGARQAAEAARRAMALPLMQRARVAARVWRELPLWFPDGSDLVEGVVDLVFEEDGALVVVDYKTDRITAAQAIDQAAHHAPQLRLYARGLTLATGMTVRERLVLFTALGQVVPV